MLSWGWNVTGGGGNKFCFITWNQQLQEARERGLKIVHIDPRLRSAGPFADEWLPIRPGTDLALALALCHAIAAQGTIDRPYLRNHTNAPYLVQGDGSFLRDQGKEQVWDELTASARPYDDPGAAPALDGTYTVEGRSVRPDHRMVGHTGFITVARKLTPERV